MEPDQAPPAPAPRPRPFPCLGNPPGPRCGHTLTAISGPEGEFSAAKLVLFGKHRVSLRAYLFAFMDCRYIVKKQKVSCVRTLHCTSILVVASPQRSRVDTSRLLCRWSHSFGGLAENRWWPACISWSTVWIRYASQSICSSVRAQGECQQRRRLATTMTGSHCRGLFCGGTEHCWFSPLLQTLNQCSASCRYTAGRGDQRRAHHGCQEWKMGASGASGGAPVTTGCACSGSCGQHGGHPRWYRAGGASLWGLTCPGLHRIWSSTMA